MSDSGKSQYFQSTIAQSMDGQSFGVESIIIGFTGSLGSGCTFIAQGIKEVLGQYCQYYRVSDVLREEMNTDQSSSLPISKLQDMGNELRRKNGVSILAERCIEKIKKDANQTPDLFSNDETVILIDGIRNDGEIRCLRQFPNFYLISIQAERENRKKRVVGHKARTERFKNEEEFYKADNRDEHETDPCGQQVKYCNDLADLIVVNDKDFPLESKQERTDFFRKIVDGYLRPIIEIRKGRQIHDRPPSINETLMTMAYCVSKRSSCLKRKVGAIVASIKKYGGNNNHQKRTDANKSFQLVSSGCNDVPVYADPCVFSEYQKCYREYLQEAHAEKFKFCPVCGESIPSEIDCPLCKKGKIKRNLNCDNNKCEGGSLREYTCKCGEQIFNVFLPGAGEAPGKLLDMCRALHAEENAIIGLSRINKDENGELFLFTTTFPCNLCANKIVAPGIKCVIYAEPYSMDESKKILVDGGVKVVKFEGIKSTAFFRLYR